MMNKKIEKKIELFWDKDTISEKAFYRCIYDIIAETERGILSDLDKLFTEHIRTELRKQKIQETQYRMAIIRALSFARRKVRKRRLSTFANKRDITADKQKSPSHFTSA